MSRKLATIRKVLDIRPIKNADAIELALIGGWQCVVKKGEFKVGDLGVYFEIDSFLPIEPRYEFLRKSSLRTMDDQPGFRLRTIKLRNELSQGLLLPLATFPELPKDVYDVTEILNVKVWVPPMPATLAGDIAGPFPSDIPKTDAERIQNLENYFIDMAEEDFEVTEKLDGSSGTFFFDGTRSGICGRNWEYKEDGKNSFWAIGKPILERMQNIKLPMAIQGELVGEGINGNSLKIRGQKFFVFNIYDLENHRYFSPKVRMEIVEHLGIVQHVPVLHDRVKILKSYPSMDSLLRFADGKSCINSQVQREGIVCKSWTKTEIIFKAISNSYLINNDG